MYNEKASSIDLVIIPLAAYLAIHISPPVYLFDYLYL